MSSTESRAVAVMPAGAGDLTPEQFDATTGMAAWFFRSQQFTQYKSPEAIFVAMLMLREMGISPIAGLGAGFQVPPAEGRPAKLDFEVKIKLAALQGRVPTFRYEILKHTDEVCLVKARLSESDPWTEAEFTIDLAKKAGLVKPNSAWANYPQDQLLWKALSRWIRRYAGPAVYGMHLPRFIEEQVREIEHVDVAEPAADVAVEPTPEPAPAPAPEPIDPKKALAELARKQGKGTNEGLLRLLQLLFVEDLKLTPPRGYRECAPSDWAKAWEAAKKRWDPATGKPWKELAAEAPAAPVAVARRDESGGVQWGPPDRPVSEMQVEQAPPPADSDGPAAPDADFDLEPEEAEPAPAPDPAVRWLSGDTDALLDFAKHAARRHREKGAERAFIKEFPEGSGDLWFSDGAILLKCGCTKAQGKPAPQLLASAKPKYQASLASHGLRIMLARGIQESLQEIGQW